jgi:quercetin dioxygenase-like cupin family protein
MDMSEEHPILRRSSLLIPQQTRRGGIKERRLLLPEDSPHQNVIIVDAEQDAEVEFHQISTSESIFVLEGTFEVILSDSTQTLEAGDICYFLPKTSHGLRCTDGPGQFLVIFAPARHSNESDDWLPTLYVEAWKQYTYEDNVSHSRNNLFLGVQTALIAILTGVSGLLVGIEPVEVGLHQFRVGLIVLGILAVTFAVFASRLAVYWKEVTKSGQAYLNLRWITIRAIEEQVGLHPINLAGIEYNWREFSKSNPGKQYYPFADWESLKQHAIPPLGKVGNWTSILGVIKVIEVLWYFVLSIGALLILATVILWFLP